MSDKWVLDSYTLYDHDYTDAQYRTKLLSLGYKVFGNWPYLSNNHDSSPFSSELRIVVLGGSTTSAIFDSTWSSHLFSEINKHHTKTLTIFNGGCGSFNSHCELTKLSRDIATLKPNIVISLSGVNDTIVPPVISSGFFQFIIQPLLQGNLFSKYNDVFPQLARSLRWKDETLQMQAVCSAYGAKFFRFLQPCLCSPANPIEHLDADLKQMVDNLCSMLNTKSEIYANQVHGFYTDVLKMRTENDCTYDIVNLLPSSSQLWQDSRHPTDQGYLKIAKEIYAILSEENAFS